ncbi:unnamed protein product, partial [Aureobasidium pullulans]
MATARTIHTTRAFFSTNPILRAPPRQTIFSQLRNGGASKSWQWQRQQSRTYANGFRRGGGYQYNRFQQVGGLMKRWTDRRTFYYEVGGLSGLCGAFYIYNLEVVPRVLNRLIPHSGLPTETNNWEVHVIKDEQKNAFVIPGGKVFVFSGILDVCQGEQGLAAVLGHEIAHNVAHHSAERMSSYFIFLPVAIVASLWLGLGDVGNVFTRMVVDLVFLRPGSRKQESWLGDAEMKREQSGCGQIADH